MLSTAISRLSVLLACEVIDRRIATWPVSWIEAALALEAESIAWIVACLVPWNWLIVTQPDRFSPSAVDTVIGIELLM